MNSQSQPAPGRPVGSLGARGRRRQMVADYVAKLGGDVSEIQRRNVERTVDLELLAAAARAAALRGEESIGNVTRLEIQASKAVRMLNLPAANAAVPVMDLHDHAARRALERANLPEAD